MTALIDGSWYTWKKTWEIEHVALSKALAREWVEKQYKDEVERRSRVAMPIPRVLMDSPTGPWVLVIGGGFLNLDPKYYELKLEEPGSASDLLPSSSYYVVKVRQYTKHGSKSEADIEIANRDKFKKIEAVPSADGVQRWRVRWMKAKGKVGLEYSQLFESFDQAKSAYQNRMHEGIGVAGKEGDPVFAPVGGRTHDLTNKPGHSNGFAVRIDPWTKKSFRYIKLLHNISYTCENKMRVKAGDRVAKMGRTGNPEESSPTHVHFYSLGPDWRLNDFRSPPVPGHKAVVPWNDLPRMLPCCGEYGDKSNPKRAATAPHWIQKCGLKEGDPEKYPV